MRVLLATEGTSDAVVGTSLIEHVSPGAEIVPKQFTARGFEVVRRSVPTLVQAAHYQCYDLLVIHVDLDSTYDPQDTALISNPRCSEIRTAINTAITTLKPIVRALPLKSVLMAPAQSTEAWIMWGNEDGDAKKWERIDRHWLKQILYGNPPRGLTSKAARYVGHLRARLQGSEARPNTLRVFMEQLISACP